MAKLKKAKVTSSRYVKRVKGNGYVKVAKIDGDPALDFRDRSQQCINVGTVIRRENFMKSTDMGWIDDGTSDSVH